MFAHWGFLCARGIVDSCAFSEEPFGKRVKKPYKFLATGDWIQTVARKCTCPGKRHMQLMTDIGGKKTGNRELLKESQAYPDSLGEALVEAWFAELPDNPWGNGGTVAASNTSQTKGGDAEDGCHSFEDGPRADLAATAGDQQPIDFDKGPWSWGLHPKKRARRGTALHHQRQQT